ncbi:MAG TPA: ABC transporter permease subunit, partial [Pseudonocardia sp.]
MSDWPRLAPELVLSFQQTIYLVAWTMVIAGVLGLTIGVLLHTTRRGGLLPNPAVFQLLNVLVNVVRPIPFIIFITAVGPVTLAVMGTTIGTRSVLFPMSAMASFVIGRVVEQNLVAVEPGVIEAARAMGASKPRIILTVLIPEALGALVLGYTFIFVAVVDMSAMAGYVGGG